MDAYSISCTSPSRRHSSRIYQDLRAIRPHGIAALDPGQLLKSMNAMDGSVQVCCTCPFSVAVHLSIWRICRADFILAHCL